MEIGIENLTSASDENSFREWLRSGRFGTKIRRVLFQTASHAECSKIIRLRGRVWTVEDLLKQYDQILPCGCHPSNPFTLIKSILYSMKTLHDNQVSGLDFRPDRVLSTFVGIILNKRIDMEINGLMIRNDHKGAVRFLLYCAPEVIQGIDQTDVTAQKLSDIWGIGSLCLYILSKTDPQYYVNDAEGERCLLNVHRNPVTSITIMVGNGEICPEYFEYCNNDSVLESLFRGCFNLIPEQRIGIESLSALLSESQLSLRIPDMGADGQVRQAEDIYQEQSKTAGRFSAVQICRTAFQKPDGEPVTELIERFGIADCRPQCEYAFETKLGEGGMCRGVFGATLSTSSRTCAVKCIGLGYTSYDPDLERNIREFRSVVRLNNNPHANVLQYYYLDIVYYGNIPEIRIIMEYCEGGTLNQRNQNLNLMQQRANQSDILREFTGVLRGLHYLHSNKMVHRDLNGQNILYTADGTPKIADFGLIVELTTSATGTNRIHRRGGTTFYMAPELFQPSFGPLGQACDIWSLGCVLLKMLHGHSPRFFRKETSGDFVRLIKPGEVEAALSTGARPFYCKNLRRDGCGDSQTFLDAAENFLDLCFQPFVNKRPSAEQLLNHPFIKGTPLSRTPPNQPEPSPQNTFAFTTGTQGSNPKAATGPPPTPVGSAGLECAICGRAQRPNGRTFRWIFSDPSRKYCTACWHEVTTASMDEDKKKANLKGPGRPPHVDNVEHVVRRGHEDKFDVPKNFYGQDKYAVAINKNLPEEKKDELRKMNIPGAEEWSKPAKHMQGVDERVYFPSLKEGK